MKQQNKLPQGWKEVELGEICEIKKGNSITKNTITNGDVPVIAGGQQPAYYHNTSNRTGETLTVSGSGAYAGFVAYFDIPIFASDCSTIQSKEKNIFMKYIYYFLKGNQNRIYKLQKGIAQPHVYPKDLAVIKIPLPPLEIQKKIVSILEKAEKLKQNREDSDKLTKEYLQSVFAEMFGDPARNEKNFEKKALREISKEIQPGFAYGQFSNTKGLIHLRPFNISNEGFLIFDQIKYVPTEEVSSEKYLLSKGDILINTTNSKELVGKTALFNISQKCSFSNHMTKIRLNESLANSYYVWFVLNRYWKAGQFKPLIKSWVNQVGIDSNLLKNQIEIPLPPLELQQKFASIVEQVEKLKEKQKESKDKIDEMFNSLMQKAFKGELIR